MRKTTFPLLILPLLLSTILAGAALAQYRGGPDYFERPEEHRPAKPDTTHRSLDGDWQIWVHGGAGWVSAPVPVRRQYSAGLAGSLSGDRRFANRTALRARLEFSDLPSAQNQVIYTAYTTYVNERTYGHGWVGTATAGLAFRPWSRLWLEGGGGIGRFGTGYGNDELFVDPLSGTVIYLPIYSGWGGLWNAAVGYEFQPTHRDRILTEVQFSSMERGGRLVRLFAIRAGYRIF